jgi:hypothetical protein
MCSRCISKGVCDGTSYHCNGCSGEGLTCFGSRAYLWDNCGCKVVSQSTKNYLSGGFSRGAISSGTAGFTYSLYYKGNLISNRTEFPMNDFYASINGARQNTINLLDGNFVSYNEKPEYSIDKWTYGSRDCNDNPFYGIEVNPKYSDTKLFATLDIKEKYTGNASIPLNIINKYDRPMKARLEFNYALNTVLGTQQKLESFDYDVPKGNNSFNVAFVTNSAITNLTVKPVLYLYDSGYSGVAIKMDSSDEQTEFLTLDTNLQSTGTRYRIVNSNDWIKIKTIEFDSTTVSIKPTSLNINTPSTPVEIQKSNSNIMIYIIFGSVILIVAIIISPMKKRRKR